MTRRGGGMLAVLGEEEDRRSFFWSTCYACGRRRGGNALRQVSRTSRGRRAPLHGGVAPAHICFVDDGTPGDCTLEEKCALRSCLMSIHALAWMSISAHARARAGSHRF